MRLPEGTPSAPPPPPPRGRHPNQSEVAFGGPEQIRVISGPDMKHVIGMFSVVATLLATVTFAAAFKMPGGYNSSGDNNTNSGNAVLMKKISLKVFIFSDTIAMCCSITAAMLFLVWTTLFEDTFSQINRAHERLIRISWGLLQYAVSATVVAFVTCVYVVTASEALWVAILVCIAGSVVLFVVHSNFIYSCATGDWKSTFSVKEILRLVFGPAIWLWKNRRCYRDEL